VEAPSTRLLNRGLSMRLVLVGTVEIIKLDVLFLSSSEEEEEEELLDLTI